MVHPSTFKRFKNMEIATYSYQHISGVYPFKKFEHFSMKVEVLEELRGGWLRIKFLGYHADGRTPGTVTRAQGKSVKRVIDVGKEPTPNDNKVIKNFIDRFDPELTRKPYKDD